MIVPNHTPNLLVTDDDSAFRGVLRDALVSGGFRVTEAENGEEALEILSGTEVHVALVDLHMPRMTGLDLMRHLVRRPASPPCVLMSAALDDQVRREAERMRAYRVLSKPIRLGQIREVVSAALADVYGWRPAPHPGR